MLIITPYNAHIECIKFLLPCEPSVRRPREAWRYPVKDHDGPSGRLEVKPVAVRETVQVREQLRLGEPRAEYGPELLGQCPQRR